MDPRDDARKTAARAATELARVTALHGLALGMTHSLNNVFTAVLGEATFLQETHKDDREVDEACLSIRDAIDRCARMTRALLARRTPVGASEQVVDLVRLVRDLARVLEDALSRRFRLSVDAPDDTLLTRGSHDGIEALVLLLVQHAESLSPGPAALELRVAPRDVDETVVVEVAVTSDSLAPGCERSLADADGDAPGPGGLTRVALHGVADAQRTRLETSREEGTLTLRAVFAAVYEGE